MSVPEIAKRIGHLDPHTRDQQGYSLCQRCRCRIDEYDEHIWLCESCREIVNKEISSAMEG